MLAIEDTATGSADDVAAIGLPAGQSPPACHTRRCGSSSGSSPTRPNASPTAEARIFFRAGGLSGRDLLEATDAIARPALVNLAARTEAAAGCNQFLITPATRRAATAPAAAVFTDLPPRDLKGLDGPMTLVDVRAAPAA